MEPLYEKYIFLSPYNYAALNPIKFLDLNGLDLTLGGEVNVALNDLKSLFSDISIQNRITVGENNKVDFDISGLDLNSDAALQVLNNIINESNKNYLFEVNDITFGIAPQDFLNGTKTGDQMISNLGKSDGVANFSKTPRNIDGGTGPINELPKNGFDGQITLGNGSYTKPSPKGSNAIED